jgi:branched-chain amino acid transport system permease protein
MIAVIKPKPPIVVRLLFGAALATVFLYVIPFAIPSYLVSQFATVLTFAIAIIGINLVTGYGGAITLGHAAFVALGSYTTSILVVRYGWNPYATLPVAAALSWLAGWGLGFPALRLQGLYLAMGTLVLSITVPALLKRFDGFTGGVQGLNVGNPESPVAWLDDSQWIYFVCLATMAILHLAAHRLLSGPLRRAMIAARDNYLVASVLGVDRAPLATATFAMSSLYAGVAGSLYAMIIGFVSPDTFNVMLSLSLFVGAVVGGITSIGGAIVGATFIQFVPIWASDIDVSLGGMIFGGTLILTLVILPSGVGGLIGRLYDFACLSLGWTEDDQRRQHGIQSPKKPRTHSTINRPR